MQVFDLFHSVPNPFLWDSLFNKYLKHSPLEYCTPCSEVLSSVRFEIARSISQCLSYKFQSSGYKYSSAINLPSVQFAQPSYFNLFPFSKGR